jgi:hypothetical protein
VHQLAPLTLLACGGCHADVMALYNELTLRSTVSSYLKREASKLTIDPDVQTQTWS